uniref:Putative capsid protein n=1 Tax=Atrato Partiti-like virus 1 TaxID=2689326 RepID=A0A6B9KGN8_9VIRU|nr:putative capsid protein [Atrato Partiti-like virus 1]
MSSSNRQDVLAKEPIDMGENFGLEFFEDLNITVEEIPIDKDEEYKQYALSIYERIRNIQSPTVTSVVQEALVAQSNASTIPYVSVPLIEPEQEFTFSHGEIEGTEIISVQGVELLIPIPTHEATNAWRGRLHTYAEILNEQARNLAPCHKTIITDFQKAEDEDSFPLSSTRLRSSIRNLVISTMLKEVYLKRALHEYSQRCSQIKTQPDPADDGLWITREKPDRKVLSKPVMVQPLQRKMKFDSKTTLLLIQMQFSQAPDVRAQAKLDLNAKLDAERIRDVLKQPEVVLAIALAEARLTALEVLATIFPRHKDKGEHTCLSCMVAIQLQTPTIYHRRCKTVEWLTKYQPFKYDATEGAIVPISRAYISSEHRYRMCQLLELHAQLNGDIVIKNGSETTIWSRNQDGTLRRQNLATYREEDQIGTTAWRRKHGFTTKHGAVK